MQNQNQRVVVTGFLKGLRSVKTNPHLLWNCDTQVAMGALVCFGVAISLLQTTLLSHLGFQQLANPQNFVNYMLMY